MFSSEARGLEAAEAKYTGAGVEVDGRIVTASGPESVKESGEAVAGLLAE